MGKDIASIRYVSCRPVPTERSTDPNGVHPIHRFLYDGARIQDDDTPASLGMEEGDAIDVMVERESKLRFIHHNDAYNVLTVSAGIRGWRKAVSVDCDSILAVLCRPTRAILRCNLSSEVLQPIVVSPIIQVLLVLYIVCKHSNMSIRLCLLKLRDST